MKASILIKEALQFCQEKASWRVSGISDLRRGDKWTHSTFRYGLARQISNHLLNNYREIKAVYIFGSTLEDRAGSTSDVDLILVVQKKNELLLHYIRKLKAEVLRAYKKLAGNGTAGLTDLLDVNIVDDEELKQKKGCASLIDSIYTPAIKI
ncbi:hypothetical protein AUJ66_04795 [Candidatus Desantisbacteria bacterium CG1_02_38_46]|uniref:Polymerase beta nucleotidyltransferase domain-containing protein n=3 Tax=unclassified Candidatus Desantisiibacteriota TaxID=3106372 RepID=A0A2H9PBB3_9BACT|nr:MAG: hypothetical protein AUJ66_04795 [Candidatus Desantisbacteria bacterium CG1_02_38_46]PIU51208.1 MAG: hypothetical protein COS91_05655 [Candidatus Desantisbacteria bacterium CG07_land_8_20_14_0_80_39_15]PIZ16045.1 MAG: hypothetical protein COY51_03635 [Candidatus Desantisbacteria bacterium CG_4_10_14_0_8_um_filter_39_17]